MDSESFNSVKNYKGTLLEFLVSKNCPHGRGVSNYNVKNLSLTPPIFQCTVHISFDSFRTQFKSIQRPTKKEAEQHASYLALLGLRYNFGFQSATQKKLINFESESDDDDGEEFSSSNEEDTEWFQPLESSSTYNPFVDSVDELLSPQLKEITVTKQVPDKNDCSGNFVKNTFNSEPGVGRRNFSPSLNSPDRKYHSNLRSKFSTKEHKLREKSFVPPSSFKREQEIPGKKVASVVRVTERNEIETISLVEIQGLFLGCSFAKAPKIVHLYDIENIVPELIEGEGFHLIVKSETKKLPSLNVSPDVELFQCISTSRCKDACDILISLICGILITLPFKIKFKIYSKDHFAGAIRDDLGDAGFGVELISL